MVYRGTTKDRYRATRIYVSPPPGPNTRGGVTYGWPEGLPIPEFNMWTDNYFAWGHWGAQHYDIWFIWHTHPPIDDGTQPPSSGDLTPSSIDQVVISEKCVHIVNKSGNVTERMPTDEFFK